MLKVCKVHGLTEFKLQSRGYYRCKQCTVDAVQKRREALKSKSIDYKGGKCSVCGYDRCTASLEFHHINPKEKSFGLSDGNTRSWEKTKVELDKCILVCANCHREIHYNIGL